MVSHPNRRRATKDRPAAHVAKAPDHDYSALLSGVQASFAAVGDARLFQTDAEDLYDIYLDALPSSDRQEHNCHSCRRFIQAYGGLVTISRDGQTVPVMWSSAGTSDFYAFAFDSLAARVKRARVVTPFLTKNVVWGLPQTGAWTHIAVTPAASRIFRERLLTADQAMAAAKENYRTVVTALAEYKSEMLDEALRVLEAGALARSERFVGPVKWLRTLHDRPKGRAGENVLWAAIASAPDGYCHPRASVIAPLLDDIVAGLPFADIKARFDAKVAPLQYQRPQAAPTAGNIKAAEASVAKLGIGPSLERRFARVDEMQAIWAPKGQPMNPTGGVFGHLKAKGAPRVAPVDLPSSTLTWDKFARTILPNAGHVELLVPGSGRFIALTTAVHADAPPVLKWDRDDARNPVAWYVYPNGSPARQWGLTGGTWANVLAISLFPNQWGAKPMSFISDGCVLALEGASDTHKHAGNALFPECLRDDLHGLRATIEAYSRSATLSGREGALACGYDVRKASADCRLRVFANGAWTGYSIDRWD